MGPLGGFGEAPDVEILAVISGPRSFLGGGGTEGRRSLHFGHASGSMSFLGTCWTNRATCAQVDS